MTAYTACPEHAPHSPCEDHFPCDGCGCLRHGRRAYTDDDVTAAAEAIDECVLRVRPPHVLFTWDEAARAVLDAAAPQIAARARKQALREAADYLDALAGEEVNKAIVSHLLRARAEQVNP